MRRAILLTLLLCVAASGCGKKEKGKDNPCQRAQKAAAELWTAAAKAWDGVAKKWSDKTLIPEVKKALEKRATSAMDKPKVAAQMVTFKDFVKFKIGHAKKTAEASRTAAKAATGKDAKKARRAASRAFAAGYDPSTTRYRAAAWHSEPMVVAVDEAQQKAYTKSTEARNLSKKAAKLCMKK
jgi:hypothetical protein